MWGKILVFKKSWLLATMAPFREFTSRFYPWGDQETASGLHTPFTQEEENKLNRFSIYLSMELLNSQVTEPTWFSLSNTQLSVTSPDPMNPKEMTLPLYADIKFPFWTNQNNLQGSPNAILDKLKGF